MRHTVQLLLTETVDGLGIVGDVVGVKAGYARNFLLPRGYATVPSDEAIAELAEKRKVAEKELADLRAVREKIVGNLDGLELHLERSCNDFGMLYGSVTQKDVAAALGEKGYEIKAREVRLPQAIKRVDSYEIPIKLATDLEATIKLWVVADRDLPTDEDRVEMEFDNEGNLIEPGSRRKNDWDDKKRDDAPSEEGEQAKEETPAEA